jgi:accessory gene regulator protein AgrB
MPANEKRKNIIVATNEDITVFADWSFLFGNVRRNEYNFVNLTVIILLELFNWY